MNRKKVKNNINFALVTSGMSGLTAGLMRSKNQARILLYHRVNDLPQVEASISDRLTVSAKTFHTQIKYLIRNFNIVAMDELIQCIRSQTKLPENAVIITFDDGYLDNYNFAFPILKKFQVPATIYLATDFINSNRYLWWDILEEIVLNPEVELKMLFLPEFKEQGINFAGLDRVGFYWEIYSYLKSLEPFRRNLLLKKIFQSVQKSQEEIDLSSRKMLDWEHVVEMSQYRISFGAHTQSHTILSKISLAQATNEIVNSKNEIEYRIQKRVTSFAYPNGGPDTFNHDIIDILEQSGFESAVTTVKGFVKPHDDVYQLRRYNIDGEDNLSTFKCKISGVYELLANMKK